MIFLTSPWRRLLQAKGAAVKVFCQLIERCPSTSLHGIHDNSRRGNNFFNQSSISKIGYVWTPSQLPTHYRYRIFYGLVVISWAGLAPLWSFRGVLYGSSTYRWKIIIPIQIHSMFDIGCLISLVSGHAVYKVFFARIT